MWSVVEKTALAEAEVEYEDFTSDTVWVKFPVLSVMVHGSRQVSGIEDCPDGSLGRPDLERRVDCHLDNHALDASGESRDLLLVENRLWAL